MSVQVAVSEVWGEEDVWDPAYMGTVSVYVTRGAWLGEYLKSECACDQMLRDEVHPACTVRPVLTQNARQARFWRRRLGMRAALSSWGQSSLLSWRLCEPWLQAGMGGAWQTRRPSLWTGALPQSLAGHTLCANAGLHELVGQGQGLSGAMSCSEGGNALSSSSWILTRKGL